MSRGCARTALRRRIERITADWKLTFKGAKHGALTTPAVFEQRAPSANDDRSDIPCVLVHLGKVRQQTGGDGKPSRVATVTLVALTYAEDSEQGYRDAENLVEAVELALIANPWLDGGRYELVGPWDSDVANPKRCVFESSLTCGLKLQPIETIMGPNGRALEEML